MEEIKVTTATNMRTIADEVRYKQETEAFCRAEEFYRTVLLQDIEEAARKGAYKIFTPHFNDKFLNRQMLEILQNEGFKVSIVGVNYIIEW